MMKLSEEKQTVKFNPVRFISEGFTDRDAPSLYGQVPGRGLRELWDEKVHLGLDTFLLPNQVLLKSTLDPFFQKLGHRILDLKSCFVQKTDMPFLRAILDAASFGEKNYLLRIEAQAKEYHDRTRELHLPIRAGRVPERYWIELQHQMIVSGIEEAYFVSTMDGNQAEFCLVKHDAVFCSNHVAECINFMDHVRRSEPLPGLAPIGSLEPELNPNQMELPIGAKIPAETL